MNEDKVYWDTKAYKDYLSFCKSNPRIAKKIRSIIKEIKDKGFSSIGKCEILRRNKGERSTRIDSRNRLVYKFISDGILIMSCSGHYGDT